MAAHIGFQELLFGTLASAAIVMFGAAYALCFALARVRGSRSFGFGAALAYALLTLATGVLVAALALDGFWLLVVGVMLAGYLLLPQAVWHLCVGTHGDAPGEHAIAERTL